MNRRGFLTGLAALAAPAVITTPGLLMPVKKFSMELDGLHGDPVAVASSGSPFKVIKTFQVVITRSGEFEWIDPA